MAWSCTMISGSDRTDTVELGGKEPGGMSGRELLSMLFLESTRAGPEGAPSPNHSTTRRFARHGKSSGSKPSLRCNNKPHSTIASANAIDHRYLLLPKVAMHCQSPPRGFQRRPISLPHDAGCAYLSVCPGLDPDCPAESSANILGN